MPALFYDDRAEVRSFEVELAGKTAASQASTKDDDVEVLA